VLIGALLVSLLPVLVIQTADSASVSITVYDQNRPGWESAVGVYEEEFFTDATLNPGVSVVSDVGYVNTTKGVWWDRLVCPAYGLTTTRWEFATPIIGFGGNWNPGVPGGPGANIAVAINGSWVSVGEIPKTYTGQFWGFVSIEPFSKVRLIPGSNCYPPGGAWCETYELDNMVYSQVPVGRIFPDKAKGLAIDVIGKDYGYDLPGWWPEKIKGYTQIDENYRFLASTTIESLDCSGLSFWSFNRAYYDEKELSGEEFDNRPLYWYGVDGQCKGNIEGKCEQKELSKEELKVGDLLFFDAEKWKWGWVWNERLKKEVWQKIKLLGYGQDGTVDHVAMYVDPFTCKGGECYCDGEECNIVEATAWKNGKIIGTTVDKIIERITNLAGEGAFVRSDHVIDAKVSMKFKSSSPVDLIIVDPDGIILTKEIRETIGMEYLEYDINGDGELDDIIASPERKIGDYLIQVVPEPDALPTDTYSLEVTANGQTIVLAEDVPISDIPRAPYIIRSTDTEIIPIIPTFVDFDPDTLNLKSKGQWVTSYIELPADYDINTIDLESIRLNDQIPITPEPTEIGDYDENGIPDLMVKFDRLDVQSILEVGDEVKIMITGKLINGKPFEGSDIIRVIDKGKE